jgi:hypothetical protein
MKMVREIGIEPIKPKRLIYSQRGSPPAQLAHEIFKPIRAIAAPRGALNL